MTAGRPTKYNPELVEKAQEYLDRQRGKNAPEANGFREVIPSACGLALELGVSETTLYRWRDEEDKAEFRDILDGIQFKQKQLLLNHGLSGEFNSAITKLVLGKHGFHEKTETDSTLRLYAQEVDDMDIDQLKAELERGA